MGPGDRLSEADRRHRPYNAPMADGPAPTIFTDLAGSWRQWVTAWQGLGDNPLWHYFGLARHRRRAAIPAWKRRLPYVIILALALGGLLIPLYLTIIWSGPPDYEMLAGFALGFLLAALGLGALVFLTNAIYETALQVMGLLAVPGLKVRSLVIDDLCATTLISDREVVVAMVRLCWPRLALGSLMVAAVFWLILLAIQGGEYLIEWRWPADDPELLMVVLFGPLTIAGITLSGALAGLIYILFLLAAGEGLGNTLYASAAGVVAALAHLAQVPSVAGSAIGLADTATSGYYAGPETVAGLALAATLVIVLLFSFLLARMADWPRARPFIPGCAPLLLPLGLLLIAVFLFWNEPALGDYMTAATLEYTLSWGGVSLANCLAVPLPGCFGAATFDDWLTFWGTAPFEFWRFPLLVVQQLVMIAVAAWYARRAVRRRRANMA